MIDFNVKPREKSEDERKFDKLNELYEEKFGNPYVFAIGIDSDSWDNVLSDIQKRIENNEPQPQPDYEPTTMY